MASVKKIKKAVKKRPPPKLDENLVLNDGSIDGNCYAVVLSEFVGGHDGYKRDPKRPLTDKQWMAVLKQSYCPVPSLMFGGTSRQVDADHYFGQNALAKFLRRNGAKVTKTKTGSNYWFVADVSKELLKAIQDVDAEAEYEGNDADDDSIWGRY